MAFYRWYIVLALSFMTSLACTQVNEIFSLTEARYYVQHYEKRGNEYVLPFNYLKEGKLEGGWGVLQNKEIRTIPVDSFDFGLRSIYNLNDQLYTIGEKPNDPEQRIALAKINKDLRGFEWQKTYLPSGPISINSDMVHLDGYFYILNTTDIDPEEDYRVFELLKVDTLGNKVWSRLYGSENDYAYGFKIDVMQSGDLLLSGERIYDDRRGRFISLHKVDTLDGTQLWRYESTKKDMYTGDINAVELSNGNIVMTYERDVEDMWQESYQWGIKYLDPQLKEVYASHTLLYEERMNIWDIEEGEGDYFYTYGDYENRYINSIPLINKIDINGDTLFSHMYYHEDLGYEDANYYLFDIIEESPDLITVNASIIGDKDYTWIFQIDGNGCYIDGDCGDLIEVTPVIEEYLETDIHIYPNPSSNWVNIESATAIQSIKVYDFTGKMLDRMDVKESTYALDITSYEAGLYLLEVTLDNGDVNIKKILKL